MPTILLVNHNGYRLYVDITKGEKLSEMKVANMDISY